MNYQKDLEQILETCEQINDLHSCLDWLDDGESLERLGITSSKAVELVYSEIIYQISVCGRRKLRESE